MQAESVPFCERNIRLWLVALAVVSALVLAYAISLATSRSTLSPHGGASPPAGPQRWGAPAPLGQARLPALAPGFTPDLAPPAGPAGPGRGSNLVLAAMGSITGRGQAQETQTAFNRAADIIRPSVVNINAVRYKPQQTAPALPGAPHFVDPFNGRPDKVYGNVLYESVGSGVIVDHRGYVVTNEHLVAGATAFLVTRFNHANEHLSARLVATDSRHDLALLKLEGSGPFSIAELADSSRVEVGDWVLAVGNPFGLGHTVTAGIISGRRASLVIAGTEYRGLLQTDAPINQGSSGGPLVNLSGQVIGINTAIYAPTGVFNGTGFAIPANRVGAFVAARVALAAGALARTEAPASPRLGLTVVDVTPALALRLHLRSAGGVFVSSVAPASPAEGAGIARGDVITAVAGQTISDGPALAAAISRLAPGAELPITVWRAGKVKSLRLRVPASPGTRGQPLP